MQTLENKVPARQISVQSHSVVNDETTTKSSAPIKLLEQDDKQHVIIYQTFPKAKAVFLAGSFNGWKPVAASLQDCWCNFWRVDLMLSPGRYEYRFVVDGKWTDDALNPNRVPNTFGGYNNILMVEKSG